MVKSPTTSNKSPNLQRIKLNFAGYENMEDDTPKCQLQFPDDPTVETPKIRYLSPIHKRKQNIENIRKKKRSTKIEKREL